MWWRVATKEKQESKLHIIEGDKRERLQALYDKWYACTGCFLGEHREITHQKRDFRHEICFADGNPDSGLMIIGEAPGEEEERTSIPFVGKSGIFLNSLLAQTCGAPHIKELYENYQRKRGKHTQQEEEIFNSTVHSWRQENLFITNAVSCRPPEGRPPNKEEINACWNRLHNMIYIVDPMLIVAVGSAAIEALTKKKSIKMSQSRGKVFDVKIPGMITDVTYPIIPVFHPSYLLRKADWNITGGDYDKTVQDWRKIFRLQQFLREKANQ